MWPASASRRCVISRQHAAERIDRDLALVVQDLHEARHVRALEVVRQVHVHVEVGDGVLLAGGAVLDPHRVADVLDADAVDRDAGACRRGPARPRPATSAGLVADSVHGVSMVTPGLGVPLAAVRARSSSVLAAARAGVQAAPATRRSHQSLDARRRPRRRRGRRRAGSRSRQPCSMKRSGMPSCSRGRCRPAASSSSATRAAGAARRPRFPRA